MKHSEETINNALKELKKDFNSFLGNNLEKAIEKSNKDTVIIYNSDCIIDNIREMEETLVQDNIFEYAMYENFFMGFIEMIENEEEKIYTAKELCIDFHEWIRECGNIFFRFKDNRKIKWEEALEICKKLNNNYPTAIIENGEYHSTFGLDKNVVYFQ